MSIARLIDRTIEGILKDAQFAYDYIIYTDGTNVFAFNTKTKQIEFVNIDPAIVIQSAMNNLPNGGKVFLKRGLYLLNSLNSTDLPSNISGVSQACLVIPNKVKLVGEDKLTTTLAPGPNIPDGVPIISNKDYYYGGTSNVPADMISLENLTIYCDSFSWGWGIYKNAIRDVRAIKVANLDYLHLKDVDITNVRASALWNDVPAGSRVYSQRFYLDNVRIIINTATTGDIIGGGNVGGYFVKNLYFSNLYDSPAILFFDSCSGIFINGFYSFRGALAIGGYLAGDVSTRALLNNIQVNMGDYNMACMFISNNEPNQGVVDLEATNVLLRMPVNPTNNIEGIAIGPGGVYSLSPPVSKIKLTNVIIEGGKNGLHIGRGVGYYDDVMFYNLRMENTTLLMDGTASTGTVKFIGGKFVNVTTNFVVYPALITGITGYDTSNFKVTGLSVPVGVSGAYGSAVSITSLSGIITYPRVKITWGGTFGTGETVTVQITAVYSDGTTASITKSATAVGSLWLTDDDVFALITQGKDITQLQVSASSNLASTSVTVTVNAYGKG